MTKSRHQQLADEIVRQAVEWYNTDASTLPIGTLAAAEADLIAAIGNYVDAAPAALSTPRTAFAPGSETSEAAAILARPMIGSVRRRIIDEIRASSGLHPLGLGLTDDELEHHLKRKHTTVSSARNWLVNNGWLVDSGYRRLTTSGRDAVVWTLTPAAIHRLAAPEWMERSK